MVTLSRILLASCLALFLGTACVPVTMPVSGNTLFHDSYPHITVTAKPPLHIAGAGKQWGSLTSDSLVIQPLASFNYTLYSTSTSGPVTAHAHALILQPTDTSGWFFLLESQKKLNSLHYEEITRGGQGWSTQVLRIPAEHDWFSALWQVNGRTVPKIWLAKRFTATPEKATRVVAEYREPWPSCLDLSSRDLLATDMACVGGFIQRADTAFSLNEDPLPATVTYPPVMLHKPKIAPDLDAMAGRVEQEDRMSTF